MKLVMAKDGYRKVGDKYLLAKKCTKCGRWLVANTDNFIKSKTGKFGLLSQCKECRAEYRRQYYQKHKDKEIEYAKQWKKDNSDKAAEHKRQYYQKHKDEIAEYKRQWRKDNSDKVAEKKRQYYQEHKDEEKERTRQWKKDNSDKVAEYNRQWRENNKDKVAEYSRKHNEKRRQARIDAIIAQKRAEYEAERASLVDEKTCRCCGRTLPASEFYTNKKSKDHLGSYCKECHNKKMLEKYYHNLETKGWA